MIKDLIIAAVRNPVVQCQRRFPRKSDSVERTRTMEDTHHTNDESDRDRPRNRDDNERDRPGRDDYDNRRRRDDEDADRPRSRRDDYDDDRDYDERPRRRRRRDYDDDYDRRRDPMDDPAMRMIMPIGVNAMAIISGYLGLISVLLFPAPFALLTGILAVRQIKRDPRGHGMGRATFGIIMGGLFSVVLVIVVIALVVAETQKK
jgi:hypothetical protein